MHFIGHGDRIAQLSQRLHGKLKAQVHAVGADVQKEIARRRHGMAIIRPEFAERMQGHGTWLTKQLIPSSGTEAANA
ncbi:MAG: hypothetical protein NTAFB09_08050 [Nitrosospira sp.]